jgi:hypothetical protein
VLTVEGEMGKYFKLRVLLAPIVAVAAGLVVAAALHMPEVSQAQTPPDGSAGATAPTGVAAATGTSSPAPTGSPVVPPPPSLSPGPPPALTPSPTPYTAPAPAAPFDGVVVHAVDAATGSPITNATVRLSSGQAGKTGPDGTLSVSLGGVGLTTGPDGLQRITLVVQAAGYGDWTGKNVYFLPGRKVEASLASAAVTQDWSCIPRAAQQFNSTCSGLPDGPVRTEPAPAPQGAQPLTSCSGYYSDVTPPPTIRIYDVLSGTIVVRDFKTYVKEVLPNEWIPSWGSQSLQSGAMAVRNFGWWWVEPRA